MPTSTLRDLITRYAKWQEAGGVRQSIMISNRRGSAVSNEENEADLDHDGDVIAWDFDAAFSDVSILLLLTIGHLHLTVPVIAQTKRHFTLDTQQGRSLRSPSQGLANLTAGHSAASSPVECATQFGYRTPFGATLQRWHRPIIHCTSGDKI